jgi:hypothetical protein
MIEFPLSRPLLPDSRETFNVYLAGKKSWEVMATARLFVSLDQKSSRLRCVGGAAKPNPALEPTPGLPAVSGTEYPSLQILAGQMSLRDPDEVATLADQAGFR